MQGSPLFNVMSTDISCELSMLCLVQCILYWYGITSLCCIYQIFVDILLFSLLVLFLSCNFSLGLLVRTPLTLGRLVFSTNNTISFALKPISRHTWTTKRVLIDFHILLDHIFVALLQKRVLTLVLFITALQGATHVDVHILGWLISREIDHLTLNVLGPLLLEV
jgi:hypothetical protein